MKYILFLAWSILVIFPSAAQKKVTITTESYSQWRNKSPFGITVRYDHRNYNSMKNYLVDSRVAFDGGNMWDTENNQEPIDPSAWENVWQELPKSVKVKQNSFNIIRLQPDIWVFPFLNLYAFGGKIYNNGTIHYLYNPEESAHKISSDGWEYGFGVKSEYFYKGFKPQIGYSMYWNHFDKISNKTKYQEIDIKLGYSFHTNSFAIKNIHIYAGGTYNYTEFDITYKIDYYVTKEIFQNKNFPLHFLNEINSKITPTFIYHDILFQKMHSWNMNTSIDLEIPYGIHIQFEGKFLGNHSSFSTALSYRLFGKR